MTSAHLEDPGSGAPNLSLTPGGPWAPGHIDSVKLWTRVWAHVVTVESKLLTPTNSYNGKKSLYFPLLTSDWYYQINPKVTSKAAEDTKILMMNQSSNAKVPNCVPSYTKIHPTSVDRNI